MRNDTMTGLVHALTIFAILPFAATNVFSQSGAAQPKGAAEKQSASTSSTPSKPAPRTPDGHPDLNGYWKGTKDTVPTGNIGKDLPGLKLPFTPAGEAAWKHNVTATVDPEAICFPGGIPRHNASGLPFRVLQTSNRVAFLYFYTYYRLIPIDGAKHTEDPDPSFFGEEIGSWDGDALVVDSTGFKDTQVWADENGSPHSDALHVIERWTGPIWTIFMSTRLSRIQNSTLIRSNMRAPGYWAKRVKNSRSTHAAKTMSTGSISGSDPVLSGLTDRADMWMRRRYRLPLLLRSQQSNQGSLTIANYVRPIKRKL